MGIGQHLKAKYVPGFFLPPTPLLTLLLRHGILEMQGGVHFREVVTP